jgi:hypothetical protein
LVIELGVKEGKYTFRSTRWKALVIKCRNGSIWEKVVRNRYSGVKGNVDINIVINL